MKYLKHGAIGVGSILFIAIIVFWNQIQDVRAVLAYSEMFEADTIDKNFASMYKLYPSIRIEPTGPTAQFEEDIRQRADIIPVTFSYKNETITSEKLLDRFHWRGMAVMHNGKLVYEAYDRGNTAQVNHIEMSITKSLTSILIGVAWDEGAIEDLQAKVTEYIPELTNSGYANVTIQQVLDMTSGIRYVEDYADLESDVVKTVVATLRGSLDEYATTIEPHREPGSFNQYASIETQVLAWVLRRATGRSYEDYFREKLWSKLGVEGNAEILTDAVGEPLAYGGANLRLRDLLRAGQMVINGGISMTGERVVSEEWIRMSTTANTPQSQPGEHEFTDYELGYKNQWWFPTERDGKDFVAIGIYGQFLYINPKRNVVIAMNSAFPEYAESYLEELQMIALLQEIARNL